MKASLPILLTVLPLTAIVASPAQPANPRRIIHTQTLEQGAHHALVVRVTQQTNAQGQVITRTNRVHVLSPGLHYRDAAGQWQPSRAEFRRTEEGFVADELGCKVKVAHNLNTVGAVDLTLPSGQRLRGHPLALAYVDRETGQRAIIAELQNSTAELVATNEVLYRNAFRGPLRADVRVVVKPAGMEQDVILRSNLAACPPEKYGLVAARARLEVITEFLNPPAPRRQARVIKERGLGRNRAQVRAEVPDETLNFDSMTIGPGKAFSVGVRPGPLGEPAAWALPKATIPVAKRWGKIGERDCLVESVDYLAAKAHLDRLRLDSRYSNTNQLSALIPGHFDWQYVVIKSLEGTAPAVPHPVALAINLLRATTEHRSPAAMRNWAAGQEPQGADKLVARQLVPGTPPEPGLVLHRDRQARIGGHELGAGGYPDLSAQ
jgi:hypothetical protein